jgi:dTDP-4-dehydrorhamnose reductase
MGVDYLVTGANGQLGRAVQAEAARRGKSTCATDIPELCVEDLASVRRWIDDQQPRMVLHGGAWTDVDGCEREPHKAVHVNGTGTAHVADVCAERGIGLCYVSTDFVFDGRADRPYREDDLPNPISAYGRSKLLGEQALLAHARDGFYVLRTSWVFGPGGKNFPAAILARARSGGALKVVTDQTGRPTMTHDLAAAMLDLCDSGAPGGIYHASNEGQCSWHTFAVDILRAAGLDHVAVGTMTSADLDRPAARPAWSVLDTGKLAAVRGKPFPHYRDAIARYLKEELP